jgi:hypothetical protein
MNSSLIPIALSEWGALTLSLKNAPEPMEVVYLALLTRKPTEAEKAKLAGLSTEDVVYALLNGQQFLFVQ